MLTLEVSPGNYTGQFQLGMPISEIIKFLKKFDSITGHINKIDILYSQTDPLGADIILKLVDEGVVLRFEPHSQRLRLIEIHDVTKVVLSYGGVIFSGPSVDASFVKIYEVFGPTYPGTMEGNVYNLSYPGVTFQFPIPPNYVKKYQADNAMPMEFPNGTTPTATRMIVFHGSDLTNVKIPKPIKPHENELDYFSEVKIDVTNGIELAGRHINFYMSPQDVLMEIGKPDKIYYKRHDKLRIHASTPSPPTSPDDSTTEVDYFYNYFSRGFDVMFNGRTHVVEKIILHTNIPGSRDFNIYVKCNFKMDAKQLITGDEEIEEDKSFWITPDLKFGVIQSYLPHETPSKPLVNDNTMANNPFGGTLFYAYRGAIFEVLKNDYLNSITIFAQQ